MASTNIVPPAAVERFIGQELPASATAIRTNAESGSDTLALLRFDAPERAADEFPTRLLGHAPKRGTIR